VLDVFLELAGNRGMAVVAALFVYLLVRLYRRIPAAAPVPMPPGAPVPEAAREETSLADSEWDSL